MPQLTVIPTPIGNLEDITYRAVRKLQEVDFVLAEDTRITKRLFDHYNIDQKLSAYHQHNEHKKTATIIEQLKDGANIGLVSDAGTPGLCDPGFLLVRECRKEGIPVECLPGADALLPALIASGLPSDRFVFEGFLPHKKGRTKRINLLAEEDRTVVLYESPHRLLKLLSQLAEYAGKERKVTVARELTKVYEEYISGTIQEVVQTFEQKDSIKGEFVLVMEGKDHQKRGQKQKINE